MKIKEEIEQRRTSGMKAFCYRESPTALRRNEGWGDEVDARIALRNLLSTSKEFLNFSLRGQQESPRVDRYYRVGS